MTPIALSLISATVRSSIGLRASFLLRSTMMFLNNLIFFCVWLILYQKVDHIRGYRIEDMALLFGVSAAGFGLGYGFMAGFSRIPELVSSGGLDSYLLKPRNILLQVITSRSEPSAWGDMLSGILLIGISGYLKLELLPLLLVSILCAALVFVAAGVIFYSIAFWLDDSQDLSWKLWELVITFSLYPESIYPQLGRVLLYTVLPAAFVSFLPVRLIRAFSIWDLALLLLGTTTLILLAIAVFKKGLSKYESGSGWSVHGA